MVSIRSFNHIHLRSINGKIMTKENLKQALISILVGAVVSFLTIMFQGLLGILHDMIPAASGALGGAACYFSKWNLNNLS